MDFRPILYVTGALLCILALGMTVPMLVDMAFHHDDWKVFFICIATTAFFGGCLVLTNASNVTFEMNIRQAFFLTTLSWVVMAAFGALPLWLSNQSINFTDAFFESMSGITTTGATVLIGLDEMPPGVLLWRSILNWLGGIGFILMAILILPFLKVGGMQLFRTESSDKSEKALPRLQHIGVLTGSAYLILTCLCAISYWVAGMSGFDAINHAMATIATGGISTHDASLGYFNHMPYILVVSGVFMILGSLPFVFYIRGMSGDFIALLRNTQVRAFLMTLLIAIAVLSTWLIFNRVLPVEEAILHSAFNVISIVTTTGFASADYMKWGAFPIAVIFFLSFIGGCTGSTTGGIKIMRFQIMGQVISRHLKKLATPNAVMPLRYENHTIGDDVAFSVMVFLFTFLLCVTGLTMALGFTGLDLITSVTGATAALTNVGPGLGEVIGPAGNYIAFPDPAKWLMSLGMLMGRLEIFTVVVLLTPHFWRR